MRIAKLETLKADAGWRDFSFLKLTTDDGLVGWSEYNEDFGAQNATSDLIVRFAADAVLSPLAQAAIEPRISAPILSESVQRGTRVHKGGPARSAGCVPTVL